MKRAGFLYILTLLCAAVTVSATASIAQAASKIAFKRELSDGNVEIFTMNPDGSNQLNLTNHPAEDGGDFDRPSWSPDGSRIVFSSKRDGNWELYAAHADGTNLTRLTNTPETDEIYASWSPDGAKMVFSRLFSQEPQINGLTPVDVFVMNADGSDPVNLTHSREVINTLPSWSPDGTQITFNSLRDGGGLEIFAMKADGSDSVNLTNSPSSVDLRHDWSPDGTQIVFSSNRDGPFNIFVMEADGSNPVNTGVEGFWPTWSPDGTQIVFSNAGDIFVMEANGSNPVNLTNSSEVEFGPVWSPFLSGETLIRTMSWGQLKLLPR